MEHESVNAKLSLMSAGCSQFVLVFKALRAIIRIASTSQSYFGHKRLGFYTPKNYLFRFRKNVVGWGKI